MKTSIEIAGMLLIALAALHVGFPRYFRWKDELRGLSLINRQMTYVHTFFIALTVFLMGLLSLSAADELLTTSLGKKVTLGFGVFWSARLVVQFVGYSPHLWRGKRWETIAHITFTLLWLYLSAVYFNAAIGSLKDDL